MNQILIKGVSLQFKNLLTFNVVPGGLSRYGRTVKRFGFVVVYAYLLSILIQVILVHYLMAQMSSWLGQNRVATAHESHVLANTGFNYFKFRGVVLDRHLFNSAGHFPQDQDEPQEQGDTMTSKGCSVSALDIKLIGTITNDNPNMSVATIHDNATKMSDVYRIGENLIDGSARVTAIETGRIVLDRSGVRECVNIHSKGQMTQISRNNYRSPREGDRSNLTPPSPSFTANHSDGGFVVLKDTYVEEQLGEGFVKIIQSARVVPQVNDMGQAEGFKIFA
ncbi:MAG: hypothetical protein OXC40_05515, partial [Proteobacteria bacterium]|nr:hypothetical protein [Pseudomonadota bacterium]